MGIDGSYLELASMADIPAGTGLGSSGSFCTALLKALYALKHETVPPETLAAQACHIEMERLKEPIGKQDQYIAAFGGLTCFEFLPDDTVKVSPLAVDPYIREALEDNLVLFFTGYSRSASAILKDQDQRSKSGDAEVTKNLHYIKSLGLRSKKVFESGSLDEFGDILNEHWQHKKQRSHSMSNSVIDEIYEYARANGAAGGKLIGAGGGGFLLFYVTDKQKLVRAMRAKGLHELRFGFDFTGSTMLIQDY